MSELQRQRVQRWASEEAVKAFDRAKLIHPELGQISLGAYVALLDEMQRAATAVVFKEVEPRG